MGRWGTSPVTALVQLQARATAGATLPDRARPATLVVDTVSFFGVSGNERSLIPSFRSYVKGLYSGTEVL